MKEFRELEDFDVRVSGLKGLTAMLSKGEDAQLIVHVALRHDQELGSFLDDRDLLPIMRTNVLVMRVALVLMQSQYAASVLDQRHLALSGSDRIPLILDAVGLVKRRLCWPGSDSYCQKLISSFQRELEVVGARKTA